MKYYEVIWVAGKRDGEILATFIDVADAINFASKFSKEHENEFDEFNGGGVAIIDENGKDIEW